MPLLRLHDCDVDLARREVLRGARSVGLTELEAQLLGYLATRAGVAVSREELLAKVWGYAPGVQTRTVAAAIKRLRKKVEPESGPPQHILTVYGEGCRSEGPGAPRDTPRPPRSTLRWHPS